MPDLEAALGRFVELEKRFVASLAQKDLQSAAQIINEGVKCARHIHWMLAAEGVVVTKNPLLRAFRDENFNLQQAIQEIVPSFWSMVSGDDSWLADVPDTLLNEGWLADSHLSRLLDPEEPEFREFILARLFSVDVMVVRKDLPRWTLRHLRTVRRCYALRLIEPCWLFLRALLEGASFHWLAEHGHVPREGRVRSIAERRLGEAIRLVEAHSGVSKRMVQGVWAVVDRANRLVHGKRDVVEPNDQETLSAIGTVIAYLEFLFGG